MIHGDSSRGVHSGLANCAGEVWGLSHSKGFEDSFSGNCAPYEAEEQAPKAQKAGSRWVGCGFLTWPAKTWFSIEHGRHFTADRLCLLLKVYVSYGLPSCSCAP
jgi:hypothetical protein